MKSLIACLAVAGLTLGVVAQSDAKKCPISGADAKEDIALEVNGKKVHFCCEKCPTAYKKKINVVASEAVKDCPISGKPGTEEQTVIVSTARKIAFCCENCPKNFAKKNGFEVKASEPGKCPLSGRPAKDEEGTSLVVNGNKVFFCCANCPKKYATDLGIDLKTEVEKCEVSGKPAQAATAQIFITSKEVSFCCGTCKAKWTEAQLKKGEKKEGTEKTDAKAESTRL
jgi:hypothetical protein